MDLYFVADFFFLESVLVKKQKQPEVLIKNGMLDLVTTARMNAAQLTGSSIFQDILPVNNTLSYQMPMGNANKLAALDWR